MGSQEAQIKQAFTNQFCLINRKSKVGKDIKNDMIQLKKIYLALRLYMSDGFQCDINCFLVKIGVVPVGNNITHNPVQTNFITDGQQNILQDGNGNGITFL